MWWWWFIPKPISITTTKIRKKRVKYFPWNYWMETGCICFHIWCKIVNWKNIFKLWISIRIWREEKEMYETCLLLTFIHSTTKGLHGLWTLIVNYIITVYRTDQSRGSKPIYVEWIEAKNWFFFVDFTQRIEGEFECNEFQTCTTNASRTLSLRTNNSSLSTFNMHAYILVF